MSGGCGTIDVGALLDGLLSREEAAEARRHLARCAACARELESLMVLEAIAREDAPTAAERSLEDAKKPPTVVPIDRARTRRRAVFAAVALLVPTAAAAAFALRSAPVRPPAVASAPVPFASGSARSVEMRLAYADLDRYRPYEVARAARQVAVDPLPLDALARMEKSGDLHGIAAAMLVAGDGQRAGSYLDRAGSSLDIDADRAAAALAAGHVDDAIAQLDAVLSKNPRHPQALFNRGLALRDRGLKRAAAESFDEVAELGEPGWSDEARGRADALRADEADRARAWTETKREGLAMVEGGALPSRDSVHAFPSYVRHYLYHAVRAAQSRERVTALLPLAEELDAVSGDHVLADYVRATLKRDLARRAPLAATYARLVAAPMPAAETKRYLDALRAAGESDMLLGALPLADALPSQIDEYERLAAASGDEWFRTIAQLTRARLDLAKEDFAAAERRLREEIAACDARRIDYRCSFLEYDLAALLARMHRPVEAHDVATRGLSRARSHARENVPWFHLALGDAARLRSQFALARAQLREAELGAPEDCGMRRATRELLTESRMLALDFDGARAELALAPRCDQPPTFERADAVANLTRVGRAPPDAESLARDLESTPSTELPGDRVYARVALARLIAVKDPAAGEMAARRALAAALALPASDTTARKAVAYAHLTLAMDAARAGRADDALAHVVAFGDPAATTTEPCTLGVAVDDERRLAVARNAAGDAALDFDEHRTSVALLPEQLVPNAIRAHLGGCARVRVYALPPLNGMVALFPPETAWSYAAAHPRDPEPAPRAIRRLLVSDVEPPASLRLAKLLASPPPEGMVWLHGDSATPSRVLDELSLATEAIVHAHGYVDLAQSDASLLVLSPEANGRYALRAGDIRGRKLRGRPVVVLGACHAAQVAPYLHEAWSLPAAFVAAGARAVLASPSEVNDAEARAFFDAVLARVRAGSEPAVALRDERLPWLARDAHSWVRDVNVFE